MSLERIRVGEVVRISRERLAPGNIIEGFTGYDEAVALPIYLAHKLHTGEGRLKFDYYSKTRKSDPNRDQILIDNPTFRNQTHFLGRVVPELALIIPADISLAPTKERPNLNKDGLAFLLRYGLWSTGKDKPKPYWVVCALFHEIELPQVWIFGRPGNRNYLDKLISQSRQEYAQRLREGLDLMFALP